MNKLFIGMNNVDAGSCRSNRYYSGSRNPAIRTEATPITFCKASPDRVPVRPWVAREGEGAGRIRPDKSEQSGVDRASG